MSSSRRQRRIALTSLSIALAAVLAGPLAAQEAPKDEDKDDKTTELARIEVTGSNIKRTDVETASPVQIISKQDIEMVVLKFLDDRRRNHAFANPALQVLALGTDDESSEAVFSILAKWDDKDSDALRVRLFNQGNAVVRQRVINCLSYGYYETQDEAISLIYAALQDKDPVVRSSALSKLSYNHLSEKKARESVVDSLSDPSPQVRKASIQCVMSDSRMNDLARPELRKLLASKNKEERDLADEALTKMDSGRSLIPEP